MDGYSIVITSRPTHPYELNLCAYLVSPSEAQTQLRGYNDIFGDNAVMLRRLLKKQWPGIPITRNDDFYVRGVDPVPGT